jgi:hypothetical protein
VRSQQKGNDKPGNDEKLNNVNGKKRNVENELNGTEWNVNVVNVNENNSKNYRLLRLWIIISSSVWNWPKREWRLIVLIHGDQCLVPNLLRVKVGEAHHHPDLQAVTLL